MPCGNCTCFQREGDVIERLRPVTIASGVSNVCSIRTRVRLAVGGKSANEHGAVVSFYPSRNCHRIVQVPRQHRSIKRTRISGPRSVSGAFRVARVLSAACLTASAFIVRRWCAFNGGVRLRCDIQSPRLNCPRGPIYTFSASIARPFLKALEAVGAAH